MSSLHPDRISEGYLTYCIVGGIMTLLAVICVGLRAVQRMRQREFWWDDWSIVAALIFALGVFASLIIISLPSIGAAGYHINTYTIDQLNTWAKIGLASEVLYNPSITLSKVSALFFYRRIFSIDGTFLLFMRIMAFFLVGSCLASIFGLIFTTDPVEAQWNVGMAFTSIDTKPFYITMATVNILLDVAILGMVQKKVWRLQLDSRRKLLVSLVFLLGAFSVVASILRIIYFETVDTSDMTYSITNAGIWTHIEMCLYIICTCLPIIYNLFRSGLQQSKNRSRKKTDKGSTALVTPRSFPDRSESEYDDERGILHARPEYSVYCQHSADANALKMGSLDPVRIRNEYKVTRY